MLSKRLEKLVSLVPPCQTVADVGCDHGYMGIELLLSGKAERVIFVDVSQPSLNKAQANCPPQFAKRVKFVCGNGLSDIRADCAVIAGMGGMEIVSILSNAVFAPRYVVLQPNRNAERVRRFVCKDRNLLFDGMIFDGKFYDMIVAESNGSGTILSPLEEQFGKTNLIEPTTDFRLYLSNERAKLTKIFNDCGDEQVKQRLLSVEQAIAATGGQL